MSTRKTRVAFFADILIKDFDGASRTMFQLIERIPNDSFTFLFFCGVKPSNEIDSEVVEIPTVPIPFNSTYKLAIPFLAEKRLTKKLKSFNPDVIHIASPSPLGSFGINYAKSNNIPVISIYHTHFYSYISYYLKSLPFLIDPLKQKVARDQSSFYNKSKIIYVPTRTMIDELTDIGFDRNKMVLWQRGINHELFNPSKKSIDFIRSFTKNEKKNVLFASRLVWEKNLATLIKIYAACEEEDIPVNFLIAGDGVANEAMMEKMPNAVFLGNLNHEDLAKTYASADIFLFTSISETYGNVVVEAMASGCPCIIADGGGSKSHVDHEVSGFLCKPEDPEDYTDSIKRLLSDESLQEKFIRNGLQYVKSLSWEILADRYFNDLEQLAISSKNKISNDV